MELAAMRLLRDSLLPASRCKPRVTAFSAVMPHEADKAALVSAVSEGCDGSEFRQGAGARNARELLCKPEDSDSEAVRQRHRQSPKPPMGRRMGLALPMGG